MFSLIESWENSDLKQEEFANQHNISMAKFKYWLKKYRKHNQLDEFVQINSPVSAEFIVRYPNGVEVLVPTTISTDNLKSLVYL